MPDCPADWQGTPEQIAADQRGDVAAAVNAMGAAASVPAVSDATDLHPFVVVRRLTELGLSVPGMDWKPGRAKRTDNQRAESTRYVGEGKRRAGPAAEGV